MFDSHCRFGGKEDVVQDTIDTLGSNQPILYLGRVRRDNIDFDIHPMESQTGQSYEEFKVNHVARKIEQLVAEGKKALIYCPFRTTVDNIYSAVPAATKSKVRCYTLAAQAGEKRCTESFSDRSGPCNDLHQGLRHGCGCSDIVQVYHFAPTGNLADYVQEIGRAARNKNLHGTAVEEFMPMDMSQLKRLHGMGELRQYQLREMLHKLYWLYSRKKHRNLLVSPDAFSYLFDSGELENRVKTGLLLLAKDLESYGFPVLVVRPKAMFTTCYANVPAEIETEFLSKYGDFVRNLYDNTVTIHRSFSSKASDVVVRNSGNIYEIRMGDLWEKHFSNMPFSIFKAKFFKGELFTQDGVNRISCASKPISTMRRTLISLEPDCVSTWKRWRRCLMIIARSTRCSPLTSSVRKYRRLWVPK